MNSDMLKIGRVVGLDNISQFKKFNRLVRTSDSGVYKTTLKYGNSYDSYIASLANASEEEAFRAGYLMGLIYQYCPRATAQNVENIMDIVVKKCSKNSANINVTLYSKDSKGMIEHSKFDIVKNSGSTRFSCDVETEAYKLKGDGCVTGKDNPLFFINELLKNIEYKEHRGVSKLTSKLKNVGHVCELNAEAEAPTGLLNQLISFVEQSGKV